MKKLLILLCITLAFNMNAQDVKSLSKSKETVSQSLDKSSFIDKFAGDQVKKLTRKLQLSEKQQTQVSDLVVSQLKTEKFQKLISGLSPEQLMDPAIQDKISGNLMDSKEFKSGMGNILTKDQMKLGM